MDSTKRILAKMLTTNTGRSFLDSGDAYGRNYERNQGRDFESEPEGTLEFRVYRESELDIVATLNVYHWLAERLEYDPKLDRRFYRWAERGEERQQMGWLQLAEEFLDHLAERGQTRDGEHESLIITGLYGDGKPSTTNTYNGEDLLSQTIQYVYFEMNGEPYVLLQIHGGCDVRGGYTRPYAFRIMDEGTDIMFNADAAIYCNGNPDKEPDPNQLEIPGTLPRERDEHYWITDDAYHWYYQGSSGRGAGLQLEEYAASENPEDRGNGVVYVDDEHNGYCPKCGGLLSIGSR